MYSLLQSVFSELPQRLLTLGLKQEEAVLQLTTTTAGADAGLGMVWTDMRQSLPSISNFSDSSQTQTKLFNVLSQLSSRRPFAPHSQVHGNAFMRVFKGSFTEVQY